MGNGFDDSGEAAAAAFLESESYHYIKMTNLVVFGNENSINNQMASGISVEPSTGSSDSGSGKVLFTAAQWQELERQTMIYKYITASIPIPHHLLIPLSTQSNRGVDLKLSNGSDPEPWRCRRTDGKKWRCSRDVVPDQKYCERHAHKSRLRSRKPVEIQSHNNNINTSALNVTPTVTTSYQHPSEWFMKSGTVPVSSSSQQVPQSMNLNPPRVGSKRTHIFPQDFEGNHQYSSSAASGSSAGVRRQNFIDSWSRSGGGGDNCSLALSMQCSGGNDNDDFVDKSFQIGDVMKSQNQWLNQGSWMGSPPGGPLGEALGLGVVSSTVKGPLNVPSPHSSSTTTRSCENSGKPWP